MYYSFVPEILALPALIYLAFLLVKKDKVNRQEWTGLIISLVFASLGKETLWLTTAGTAILLALSYRRDKVARYFWLLGAMLLAGFVYLFFIWMPEHSRLETYYGLSYYRNRSFDTNSGLIGKIGGAVLNMLSLQSLGTVASAVLLIPAGLTLFGGYWALAGALPALALIAAASHNQIHDLTNHYLIGVLPFVAVASAIGLDHINARVNNPKARSYITGLAIIVPTAITLFHQSGFIFQTLFATERMNFDVSQAAAELRKELNPDDLILIDGALQPLFTDLPKVKIILGFQGNPTRVSAEDLQHVKHVITTNDLSDLADCRIVKPGSADLSAFDYNGFYQYCEWLKSAETSGRVVKKEFIPHRLIDLKIQP